jgi:hypothetical protein
MQKEIPILFSTMMVQALLAGVKTMTRRTSGLDKINESPSDWEWINKRKVCMNRLWDSSKEQNPNPLSVEFVLTNEVTGEDMKVKCPYGKEGDVLWVRETMLKNLNSNEFFPKADGYKKSISEATGKPFDYEKIVAPIHMPKAAARIWLEVTDVRVERLHSITEEDATAEGVETWHEGYRSYQVEGAGFYGFKKAYNSFETLWTKINGAESWNANPMGMGSLLQCSFHHR